MRMHTIQVMGYLYVLLSVIVLLLIAFFGIAWADGIFDRGNRFSYRDEAFIYKNAAHDVALLKVCHHDPSAYIHHLTEQSVFHGANPKQMERLTRFLEKETGLLETELQAQGCHEDNAANAGFILEALEQHTNRWIDVVYIKE